MRFFLSQCKDMKNYPNLQQHRLHNILNVLIIAYTATFLLIAKTKKHRDTESQRK